MKLGLIARAGDTGLGNETWMYWEHLKPAKTLVVLMDNCPEYPERYDGQGCRIVRSDMHTRRLDEQVVRRFLEDLDVVLTVETMYDWRICDWARQMGVRTIVSINPELFHHHRDNDPAPDVWWYPTPWMIGEPELPDGPIVPVPCVERPQTVADPDDEVLRVLHVAGHAAVGDRNGTMEFIEALRQITSPVHVTMIGQDGAFPRNPKAHPNVTFDLQPSGVADRWTMYENQHLVVLPRKYGGRCLPALEAMSCGVPVLMPKVSPNEIWPGPRLEARKGRAQRTKFGPIVTASVIPSDIASCIDTLNGKRQLLSAHQRTAASFAYDNSWAKLLPTVWEPALRGAHE